MTARRRVSTTDRLSLFKRENGRCHLCKGLVQAGEAWDLSYEIPLALGGVDDETNWKVAHRKCHREHTSVVDAPNIAQAERREAVHLGAKAPAVAPVQKKVGKEKSPLRVASGEPAMFRRYRDA